MFRSLLFWLFVLFFKKNEQNETRKIPVFFAFFRPWFGLFGPHAYGKRKMFVFFKLLIINILRFYACSIYSVMEQNGTLIFTVYHRAYKCKQ